MRARCAASWRKATPAPGSPPYTGAGDAPASLGLISDNDTLSNSAAALFCPSKTGARLKAGILADRSHVEILDLQQWDRPVYDLISHAEFYVHSNIRRRLIIDGSPAREEVPAIPRAAFREAIVNAFCHRDWTDCGTAVQIDIYPDTVEVTNPDTFPAERTPEMYLSDKVVSPKSRNSLPQRCSAPKPSSRSAPASSASGTPAPRLEYASSTRRRMAPPPCASTATTPTTQHLELMRFQVVPS